MTADFYLQLENFSPAQVLENRLTASLAGAPIEATGKLAALATPFLEAVAQPNATPGGGSVAAFAGALAASLGQMVAGLSRKKKSQAAFADQLSEALAEFRTASKEFAEAIDRDAASFDAVMAAHKLPNTTPDELTRRQTEIRQALLVAAEVPLHVARKAVVTYERLGQLEGLSSASMLSDVHVGRLMAVAAVRGALENVAINLESMMEAGADANIVAKLRSDAAALEARVSESNIVSGKPKS
jgi:glutamate formiminotransferase/formiminotetrahydrofolate cyclodeaminase